MRTLALLRRIGHPFISRQVITNELIFLESYIMGPLKLIDTSVFRIKSDQKKRTLCEDLRAFIRASRP